MSLKSTVVVLALAGVLLPAGAALAQDDAALLRDGLFTRDRNISVTERPKPEYQPLPVRAGAFIFDPVIAAGLEYNDNIYATNTATTSDEIVHVQPGVQVVSDWSRNQVSAFARVSGNYYVDHSSENTTDYAVGAAGRLDVQHDLGFAAGGSYEKDTEPRGSESSTVQAQHPITYDVADGWIEGTKAFNRLRLTARGSVDDYSYDNGRTALGLQVFEEDRDHTTYTGAFKAEYAYLPDTSLFFSLVGNTRDYRNELLGEVSRTSSGFEATVGSNFDLSHLLRGELYLGYLEQDYDNSATFKSVSGFAARGKVEYFPTQLTTITVSGSRSVQDSGVFNVGGYLANVGAVQIDHELLRNLILSGVFSYTQDDYQSYSRTDKINAEQVSLAYLLNRAVSLNLTYAHLGQDSSGTNKITSYDINRIIASIAYRF